MANWKGKNGVTKERIGRRRTAEMVGVLHSSCGEKRKEREQTEECETERVVVGG